MKNSNNVQSAYLPIFRAHALNITAQMAMPDELRKVIKAAVYAVELPLFEVVKVNKKQAWLKFCGRLIGAIRTKSSDRREVTKILNMINKKLIGEL